MHQQTAYELVQAQIAELHRQAARERLAAHARRLTIRTESHDRANGSAPYLRPSSASAPMNPAVSQSR